MAVINDQYETATDYTISTIYTNTFSKKMVTETVLIQIPLLFICYGQKQTG